LLRKTRFLGIGFQGGAGFAEPWVRQERTRAREAGEGQFRACPVSVARFAGWISLAGFQGFRKKRSTLGHTLPLRGLKIYKLQGAGQRPRALRTNVAAARVRLFGKTGPAKAASSRRTPYRTRALPHHRRSQMKMPRGEMPFVSAPFSSCRIYYWNLTVVSAILHRKVLAC
jgi:hypothetical protein